MSAPEAPEDHSVDLARMDAQRERQAQRREDRRTNQEEKELAALRSGAATSGRNTAEQFFESQGLSSGDYASPIDTMINDILSRIAPNDPNPGSYFENVGQRVYDQEQTGFRNRSNRDIDRLFAPNFESQRIASDLDDPTLAAIESEEFGEADQYIKNLLERGVINSTGYNTAASDLEKQRYGAKARLNEIGTSELESGRSDLRDIANRGRQTASTVNLGSSFDPYSYSNEVDRAFDEFLAGLGGNLRAKAPGDLFSTSGLAAVAGAGQGGQNLKFNPNALAGVPDDEDEDEQDRTADSIF